MHSSALRHPSRACLRGCRLIANPCAEGSPEVGIRECRELADAVAMPSWDDTPFQRYSDSRRHSPLATLFDAARLRLYRVANVELPRERARYALKPATMAAQPTNVANGYRERGNDGTG